jgi:hypothetical protein
MQHFPTIRSCIGMLFCSKLLVAELETSTFYYSILDTEFLIQYYNIIFLVAQQ